MNKIIKGLKAVFGFPFYVYKIYQKINSLGLHNASNIPGELEEIKLQNRAVMMKDTYNLDHDQMYDYVYYSKDYKSTFGQYPDFINPKTFTEKMQAFKLFERKPIYTRLADKFRVREYVKEKGLEDILLPLLWDGEKPEDIPFEKLPEKYVIKMNNGCGGNIFVLKDKMHISQNDDIGQPFNKDIIFSHLHRWAKENDYSAFREWQYKNITPHIIIEPYINEDKNRLCMVDFKLYCFKGVCKYFHLFQERGKGYFCDGFYDINWTPQYIGYGQKIKKLIDRPDNYTRMIAIGEKLSQDLSFVRVDLYTQNDKIYFGEMTFTPLAGYMKFNSFHESSKDIDFDMKLGELWK